MAVREILLLGDERLYQVSQAVTKEELPDLAQTVTDLHDTLMDFRAKYGAGRAIAAPQINVLKRLIYLNIDKPLVFINPELKFMGDEKQELWDDCMSFPGLIVKVLRYKHCWLRYKDVNWQDQELELADDLAELLQHEYDHLDGILAVQRAIDNRSLKLELPDRY